MGVTWPNIQQFDECSGLEGIRQYKVDGVLKRRDLVEREDESLGK